MKRVTMDINELTPEQKKMARACTSPEELLELAKTEGVELSDEQLEAVSGGGSWIPRGCGDDYCGMFD